MATASATKKPRPKITKKPLGTASKVSETKVPRKRPSVTKPSAAKTPAPKKTVSKTPAKKAAPKTSAPRGMGPHGFLEGSDSAIIADALLSGGLDRNDVNELAEKNIAQQTGLTNRNGGEKYVPSMVSGVLNKMLATGDYEIESSWRLVKKEKPVRRPRKTK